MTQYGRSPWLPGRNSNVLLKTARFASRHLETIVMSIQPYQLEPEYSSEEAEEEPVDSGKEEVS